MNINFFHNEYEELYYAIASKTEFSSIQEFREAFIDKHSMYLFPDEIINYPLTPHSFCEIKNWYIYLAEGRIQPVFENDIHFALLIAFQWDTKCIVAELEDKYIGQLWITQA